MQDNRLSKSLSGPATLGAPIALIALTALGVSVASTAADLSSAKDLAATIALNGKPCDTVVDVKRNADSDYTAVCMDGHRYHVFVNPQGRVVVESR